MKRNKKGFREVKLEKRPMLPTVDTSFALAAPVRLRPWERVQIILAGCGGTGAYLAQHVGRLMTVLYEMGKGVHLTLVDPDVVKEENRGRQLFCKADVGQPKASVVQRRVSFAWGCNVSRYVGEFSDSLIMGCDLTVLVGCVDNAAARKALHAVLASNESSSLQFWWVDCSNGAGATNQVGRVVVGNAHGYDQLRGAFPDRKTCVALPSPALQFRDLLTPRPDELPGANLSCAALARLNHQSFNINARVAVEGAETLNQLLVTEELKCFQTEVSTAARSMRSTYNTPEQVARVINKPVSHVLAEAQGKAA